MGNSWRQDWFWNGPLRGGYVPANSRFVPHWLHHCDVTHKQHVISPRIAAAGCPFCGDKPQSERRLSAAEELRASLLDRAS